MVIPFLKEKFQPTRHVCCFSHLLFLQSKKFDDLCSEFTLHEDLDRSGAYAIADIDTTSGDIINMRLRTKRRCKAGFIPITVPSTMNVSRIVCISLVWKIYR